VPLLQLRHDLGRPVSVADADVRPGNVDLVRGPRRRARRARAARYLLGQLKCSVGLVSEQFDLRSDNTCAYWPERLVTGQVVDFPLHARAGGAGDRGVLACLQRTVVAGRGCSGADE
jgi:hypothetical protein